jgi:hypothetical protein
MQVEAPDAVTVPAKLPRFPIWWWSPLAAAACLVFALWLMGWPKPGPWTSGNGPRAEEYVARLTGSLECRWVNGSEAARPGEILRKDQRLELTSGFAEITFDSGARIILQGPARLDLNSAWGATLRDGTLKANVPPEAMGFRISSASVEVVDLGTEFTMSADASGAADVLVLQGMIEASSQSPADQRTIVLHEKQSRHFAASGVSKVNDPEQKFARLAQPVLLEHYFGETTYVHWSFDEQGGELLKADNYRTPLSAQDARLDDVSEQVLTTVRTEGRWQRALRFNGHLYAKAALPGLSGDGPHTVAFWVKVPDDARLPNAYAMVAWSGSSRKFGSHPVHIGWNRNPTEGMVGVLRTDYGGGFALGATPLRDGRWHHIAVVFVPGEDPRTPVDVKQYVDGRFEGEGKPSPPGTEVSPRFSAAEMIADTLWLGCRLGTGGPRRDRFRGELDELCIADRALEPREIVYLMKMNRPHAPEALASR